MKITRRSRKAFTLIELLVVILILAILAAMIVPKVIGRTGDAKRAKVMTDIRSLSNALEQFRLDCGRYPTTEEGLQALRVEPNDVRGWRGPYLKNPIPADQWGNEYIYEYPGSDGDDSFVIISFGADGAEGGEGENQDLSEGLE